MTTENIQETGSGHNIIEEADLNYLHEASKLPPSNLASLDHTDHVVMRKWLVEEYMNWPKTPPKAARRRDPVEMHKQTIPITYDGDNHFSVRVYNPVREKSSSLRAAMIMCHGGGWIHGYPEVDEELSEFFASELRAVVISIDYRLAPEHPFPQPLNDCYETIQWAFDHAAEYSIDTERVGLWGCSAGGNLAAGIALRDAQEHKVSRLAHVNLVVPVTCHPNLYPTILTTGASSGSTFGFSGKDEPGLVTLWDKYAGEQFSHQHASMLAVKPPPNHPPVHVTVAGRDGLRDEGIAYALHLRDAGIDTQLEIIPGVPHGITIPTTTHAARQFFRNQARVLNSALNWR